MKTKSVQYLIPQLSCRNMMRFKLAAMLDFRKSDHWFTCIALRCWFSIIIPNMIQKVWSTPNYGPKIKFKMAAALILNLIPIATFNILPTLHYRLQHPYKISCQYLSPRLNLITFWNSRWWPSAMLDFRKPAYWLTHRLRLLICHHDTKFGTKMLIDAQIMVQNRNLRWRPSAILELLYHHEVFSLGHISLSNFMRA